MGIASVKGINGTIYVYDDRVEIERAGFTAKMYINSGTKIFYYKDITAVDYKRVTMSGGFIHFRTSGSVTSAPNLNLAAVLTFDSPEWNAALRNENGVLFNKPRQADEVENVYNVIMQKWETARAASISTGNTIVQEVSAADEIRKFKQLLDDGIISQSEFDAKKKQLLGL
ncbi:SHOCT domain-containing protein [Pseudobutyrivibrio sp.]|uniref:SHOCT domain-containing protein n=1 Tax=Pseudobutyrivibrio sp. TaxID=2014367 RepID=UPI001B507AA7|nr:SHOCT domain-containing protein [Pseudobutyrivibrio sp.]